MSDTPTSDIGAVPEAVTAPRRPWPQALIWAIPIVAALIGAFLAIQSFLERGPTITISFRVAEGIQADKTKIKYKNVDVGEVKKVELSDDRSHVIVTAELTRQAESFLVEDTQFWIVRPRITGGSVYGFGTLISGAYIGIDIGKSDKRQRSFVGLETPILVSSDVQGRRYLLHGDDLSSLDLGSPVYYRGLQVGQVLTYDLDKDGKGVTMTIFINAPYDRNVNPLTRFWNVSGVDVSLDASGVKVDAQSLAAILQGGLAFQTPPDAVSLPPAAAGAAFRLFPNRGAAMDNPDIEVEQAVAVFKESARGLAPGAAVDLLGVVIGEVTAVGIDVDTANKTVSVPVELRIYPERLLSRFRKTGAGGNPLASKRLLGEMVQRGLRAQLRTANLLTGQLYIALDFFPNASAVKFDANQQPLRLPTAPGSLQGLQTTLASIVAKLDKIPFDTLSKDLQDTLHGTNALVERINAEITPATLATLADARRALGAVEHTLGQDAPLQQNTQDTLHEITRAARALRELSEYLERHPEALLRGKQADSK